MKTIFGSRIKVTEMKKDMKDRLKKFEQDYEIYIDATDAKSYWFVEARMPKKQESLHSIHRAKKYISGLNEEGNVLVFSDPEITETFSIENWGKMDTFEDFVDKALASILEDQEESDKGYKEGCGTGCS
jgi:hypothetical protein